MFPSNNTIEPYENLFKMSIQHDQNPSSKQDDNPPFFPHFPLPFSNDHELPLNQIFSQNQRMNGHNVVPDQIVTFQDAMHQENMAKRTIEPSMMSENPATQIPNEGISPMRRRNLGVVPRRRAGKKDRHSKICTAQGIRDRRMRLSLQVARKFFDLQDILGYDKASKTIEWLFTKSKKAIKELVESHPEANIIRDTLHDENCESFMSESDDVSGLEEHLNNELNQVVFGKSASSSSDPYEKDEGKLQKIILKVNKRESRDKARARARDRTREKRMIKHVLKSSQLKESNPNDLKQLGFSSTNPFEAAEESLSHDQNHVEMDYQPLDNQLSSDVGTIEDLLGTSSSTSWPSSDHYQPCYDSVSGDINTKNNFMGSLENWNVNNDGINSNSMELENLVSFSGTAFLKVQEGSVASPDFIENQDATIRDINQAIIP